MNWIQKKNISWILKISGESLKPRFTNLFTGFTHTLKIISRKSLDLGFVWQPKTLELFYVIWLYYPPEVVKNLKKPIRKTS